MTSFIDYISMDDWDLSWEEKLKKYKGQWDGDKTEIDEVCEGCMEKPTAFCRWKGSYYFYCLVCERRVRSQCDYRTVKEEGYTRQTVIQIAVGNRLSYGATVRGARQPLPSVELVRLQKMPYSEYLCSEHWRKKRQEILDRDGYKCTSCGSTRNLQVHHLYYGRLGQEIPEDLETLCKACHDACHSESIEFRRKCGFTTTALGLPIG